MRVSGVCRHGLADYRKLKPSVLHRCAALGEMAHQPPVRSADAINTARVRWVTATSCGWLAGYSRWPWLAANFVTKKIQVVAAKGRCCYKSSGIFPAVAKILL